MLPRDLVKLAFQFQEHPEIPFSFNASPDQEAGLTAHYGGESWREKVRPYLAYITGVDNFLSLAGMEDLPGGLTRDILGCVWKLGSTHHLVEPPLKQPSLRGYQLPDLDDYFARFVRPRWAAELEASPSSFHLICHSFGLFERAWALRGFNEFLMDLVEHPDFVEELLGTLAEWFLRSLDNMLSAPVDAVMLTDDYADQRGVIFGLARFRRLFKPHWARIYGRLRQAGVYSIMHVCGCAAPAVPDLIECGLDCLESLQPEAMDIYQLKREYGRDLRFWGGLGAQSTLPFGTPEQVGAETRRLQQELGRGGGYVLAGAKGIGKEVPVANVIAYLEQASTPVER